MQIPKIFILSEDSRDSLDIKANFAVFLQIFINLHKCTHFDQYINIA